MTPHPFVSVVIPTRNRCGFLKDTISSLLAQTLDQWELIVVDDASSDETPSWLQEISDPRIETIRFDTRVERSRARNAGLAAAKGHFVLFLDDDDLLPPRALQTHVEALLRYDTAIGSIGGHTEFNEHGLCQSYPLVRRTTLRNIWSDVLFGWTPVFGQYMIRTQQLRRLEGWKGDDIPCEDHELHLRLNRLGSCVVLPDNVLMYRVHDGQLRPQRLERLMTTIRQRAVKQTTEDERAAAEGILRARLLWRYAIKSYRRAQAAKALGLFYQTIRMWPGVLVSPALRRRVLPPMMKCATGSLGIRMGRWGTRCVQSWQRRSDLAWQTNRHASRYNTSGIENR